MGAGQGGGGEEGRQQNQQTLESTRLPFYFFVSNFVIFHLSVKHRESRLMTFFFFKSSRYE